MGGTLDCVPVLSFLKLPEKPKKVFAV